VLASIESLFQAKRYPGVVSAYLFGSRAHGVAHSDSDVDVGLVIDRGILPRRSDRGCLSEQVATDLIGATHVNEVDVVCLNDASPELVASVVTGGRRVYCAGERQDHEFVRTTLLRRADLRPFLERTRRLKLEALSR